MLASACCIAPLAFVLLGISGAWIGQLAAFESYHPFFLVTAAVALFLTWRKIWRVPDFADGPACAAPAAKRAQKVSFLNVAALLFLILGIPIAAPLFYQGPISEIRRPDPRTTNWPSLRNAPESDVVCADHGCATCPVTIKAALTKAPGVASI